MMEQAANIRNLAHELGDLLTQQGRTVTCAESCTGGLIAAALTAIAGSSGWFSHGWVTYSNDAKSQQLGVNSSIFEQHGAVSEPCVIAMAHGALLRSSADIAVSVSGIAGPGGAVPGKPVGTVWVAWAYYSATSQSHQAEPCSEAQCFTFSGDRDAVREQAVYEALSGVVLRVQGLPSGTP